ncbi:MAG: hypothetical protein IJK44_05270 [Bacteroidales bacterium]|nr:hypothetical protein [Bacteroidales bacterium]
MLKRIFISALLVVITSFYLFPVAFYFLPDAINTKIIIAGFGVLAFFYDGVSSRSFIIPRQLLYAGLLAVFFSLWCFYCITKNNTDDLSYANYWISFFTWIFGGYGVCFLLRNMAGKADLATITFYFALVCVSQCIIAEWIDYSPSFRVLVDSVFNQGQEFFQEVKRLYGIGAALDPAGVRFSVTLTLMAHQMSSNGEVINKTGLSLFYFSAFFIIVIIGSMIARTTWLGAGIGLAYMIVSYLSLNNGYLSGKQVQFWSLFIGLALLTLIVSVILYNTNPNFRSSLRFAFEGFFNWAETGVFRTDSTDKLNNVMWIWPQDTRSWIIGTGLFENFVYSTDIGYCRFTLYCGIPGLAIFSVFFIYNGWALFRRFKSLSILPLALVVVNFIVWLKVATDIFFIFALLFFAEESVQDTSEPTCTSSTT